MLSKELKDIVLLKTNVKENNGILYYPEEVEMDIISDSFFEVSEGCKVVDIDGVQTNHFEIAVVKDRVTIKTVTVSMDTLLHKDVSWIQEFWPEVQINYSNPAALKKIVDMVLVQINIAEASTCFDFIGNIPDTYPVRGYVMGDKIFIGKDQNDV